MKLMCYPLCSYLKVFVIGALSVTFISTLYSHIANVKSIQLVRNGEMELIWFYKNYSIIDGIGCYSSSDSFGTSFCNLMAIEMANLSSNLFILNSSNITPNPSWNCAANTQFPSTSFLNIFSDNKNSFMSTFNSVRSYILTLIISAILYGMFIIIHDWTLIYYNYKKQLNKVNFYPQSSDDFTLSYPYERHFNRPDQLPVDPRNKAKNCARTLEAAILILLWLIDVIYIMIFYPFKSVICSICCKYEQLNEINGFSYVSASWIGATRTVIMFATGLLLIKASYKFTTPIPSLDPDVCQCECNYVLHSTDFWMIFIVTVIFMINNALFLKTWIAETMYGQHYLYLKSYKLPIHYADSMNSEDPTGDMMDRTKYTNDFFQYSNYEDENKQIEEAKEDHDADSTEEKKLNHPIAYYYRIFFVRLTGLWYFACACTVFVSLSANNNSIYGLPNWISVTFAVCGAIGLVVSVCVCCCGGMRFCTNIDEKRYPPSHYRS